MDLKKCLWRVQQGEALSATGHLMGKLNSSGNVLIAARKAYFDYKSFSAQAKLFDTIGTNSVSFSKVSINRWAEYEFVKYAEIRNIKEPRKFMKLLQRKLAIIILY